MLIGFLSASGGATLQYAPQICQVSSDAGMSAMSEDFVTSQHIYLHSSNYILL